MNPTRIILRHDTEANWNTETPRLSKGEVGIAINSDGTIKAKVGTSNNQTWANAKQVSTTSGQYGELNIEDIGRVYINLYLGENIFNEGILTDCSTQLTSISIPSGTNPPITIDNCINTNQTITNINIYSYAKLKSISANFVGYQSDITTNIVYFAHEQWGNTFDCDQIASQSGKFSTYEPWRPLASSGCSLVWLENVEMWKINGSAWEYQGYTKGWFPSDIRILICDGDCIPCGYDPGSSTFECLCESNGSCGGVCPGGFSLNSLINPSTDETRKLSDFGIVSYSLDTNGNVIGVDRSSPWSKTNLTIQKLKLYPKPSTNLVDEILYLDKNGIVNKSNMIDGGDYTSA